MVRCICPECSTKGSFYKDEKNGVAYYRVYHENKEDCYLGRGPVKVEIIKDDEPPVGTITKTFE